MPRAFSSLRRSVSTPVSARTSEVLPWSIWPAVPMIMRPPAAGRRGVRPRPSRRPCSVARTVLEELAGERTAAVARPREPGERDGRHLRATPLPR